MTLLLAYLNNRLQNCLSAARALNVQIVPYYLLQLINERNTKHTSHIDSYLIDRIRLQLYRYN